MSGAIGGETVGGSSGSRVDQRRATGPRTPAGKWRSSRNARKHDIFTGGLLDEEEAKLYRRLLSGFRRYYRPAGLPEEMRVERLAMFHVLLRRLHIARVGYIREGLEVRVPAKEMANLHEADSINDLEVQIQGGLWRYRENPHVLRRCISVLTLWRLHIERQGLDWEHDQHILSLLWGTHYVDEDRAGLRGFYAALTAPEYLKWVIAQNEFILNRGVDSGGKPLPECHKGLLKDQIKLWKEKLARWPTERESLAPEAVQTQLLHLIDHNIQSFKLILQTLERNERKEAEARARQCLVPEEENRLIKYESGLSREIERMENQLEHLQRRRLGKKDSPPIGVEVSS